VISVVTVYNDRAVFDAMLRASLARQRATYELIALDNAAGTYRSAARALNEGGRRATGEFLLFAHQDVRFDSPAWLDEAERLLSAHPDLGIAGVAGARAPDAGAGERVIVSNIEDSSPPQRHGHVFLERPERVATVDECAFFVPRPVFARVPFDESTCDGWHLYAVDYSLAVRELGLQPYVLPLPLYHASGGAVVRLGSFATFERAYFRTLRKVIRKHRALSARLDTTCGTWFSDRSLLVQQFPPRRVVRALRGWVRGSARCARSGSSGG
jgi:hypothetical protein